MNNPKVSIIIPFYNSEKYSKEAMDRLIDANDKSKVFDKNTLKELIYKIKLKEK